MKRDGQEQEMPVFPVNSQRNMVIKVGGVEASNIRIKTGEEIEYLLISIGFNVNETEIGELNEWSYNFCFASLTLRSEIDNDE